MTIKTMNSKKPHRDVLSLSKKLCICTALTSLISTSAWAQTQNRDNEIDEVIAVGTHIKGSDITGTLPVSVFDVTDIDLTGAVSGDELFESIPQIGAQLFTDSRFTGVNGARGDVGSINLRDIGTGNTLVLLNGRRLVLHPGTQVNSDLVPVVSINTNALPVTGIQRLEILRDGASAIYGADAVAGVVNTVLDTNYEGFQTELRYGKSEDTNLDETSVTVKWGKTFNNDKTNVSVFGNALSRNGFAATQLRNSSTEDLRTFFEGTDFEGDTQLGNLSSQTQFGEFTLLRGGEIDAIGDDDFHIQPDSTPGCAVDIAGSPVCIDNGGSIDTSLHLDRAGFRDLVGDTDRYNIFAFVNHDFENGLAFFGEASYYRASTNRVREAAAVLSSNRIGIAGNAFYNPFQGEALRIQDYRPLDAGQRVIEVDNDSFRILGGFKGQYKNWDWESAGFYPEAATEDKTSRISNTLFQQAINRTDRTAYNPFAGGNVNDINLPNFFNSPATINSFIVDVSRDSKTTLGSIDGRISNPSIYELPGGDVGLAVGLEWRRETFSDDRDDRLDGTITFTDTVRNTTNQSDVLGSSPSPDTAGQRNTFSAFFEFAVPVVNADMNIPLVNNLSLQVAGRYENASDYDSVFRPKIAASWEIIPQVKLRGAFSLGFQAPNLEQINANGVRRVNSGREDWILCEAIARQDAEPAFTNDDNCDGVSVESVRGGSPLDPVTSTNWSAGAVIEPFENLTFTVDWWRIIQGGETENGVIGLEGDQDIISFDYFLRLNGGFDPRVVRAQPTQDEIELYTAAGLTPAGEILEVRDSYFNLEQRTISGIDFGAFYKLDANEFGTFNMKTNIAFLNTFFQNFSPVEQTLTLAQEAGTLNDLVSIQNGGNRIEQNGRPEFRWSTSVTWRKDNWGAGVFYRGVGAVEDTSTTLNDDSSVNLPVGSFHTVNLYGDYTFENIWGGDMRVRLGVRNVGNAKPPLADEFARGYFVGLYNNRGRYWYGSIRKTF